jgi:hypothetical protein
MDDVSINTTKNKYETNDGNITANSIPRTLEKTGIYIHELQNIKREIGASQKLGFFLRFSWSLFCLSLGSILGDLCKLSSFEELVKFFNGLNVIFLSIIISSFIVSFALYVISRSSNSAEDMIDQIIKQTKK